LIKIEYSVWGFTYGLSTI